MSELERIFEAWCDTQSDSEETIKAWHELERYLHENCTESIHEQISDYVQEFVQITEKQMFIAGFIQAGRLFIDIHKQL